MSIQNYIMIPETAENTRKRRRVKNTPLNARVSYEYSRSNPGVQAGWFRLLVVGPGREKPSKKLLGFTAF